MQRKVCLDTCIVIWGLLKQGKAEDEIKRLKSAYLLDMLQEEGAKIFIPSLVIAELTTKMTQENKLELLNALSLSFAAEIIPFCTAAALEYGTIRAIGKKMVSGKLTRKEMTFDSAILATCKRYGVETIYTDDNNMKELAKAFIQVGELEWGVSIVLCNRLFSFQCSPGAGAGLASGTRSDDPALQGP